MQTSDAWCGKLARVYVGNLPHSSVHVFHVLSLHYQDRLGWVKVELWKEKTDMLIGQRTETVRDEMLKGTEPCIAALNHFKLRCCRYVWTLSVHTRTDNAMLAKICCVIMSFILKLDFDARTVFNSGRQDLIVKQNQLKLVLIDFLATWGQLNKQYPHQLHNITLES